MMRKSKFGEIVRNEDDICDMIMQGQTPWTLADLMVEPGLDLERMALYLQDPGSLLTWTFPENSDIAIPEFDHIRQDRWFMPQEYRDLDIAEHVLSLCETQEQLQRVGQELMMFQERDLFDLLKFMKYLVDVMTANRVIWGVGRGSSVASYVLYLLGVHRIDSMFYDLDPHEFLR